MGLLDRLTPAFLRKVEPICTAAGLASFMDARAAFLAQKGIVEFCRVRAGVYWQKLFSEDEFQTALSLSCWRAFPPCYAMVAEMVEGTLREPAGIRQRSLPAALERIARDGLTNYAVPEGCPTDFWAEAGDLIGQRLLAIGSSPSRPVREIPDPMARKVFAVLPIHPRLVTNDYDYIFNFLRMNLLRAHEDFVRQADRAALVDNLLGPASA